MKVCEVKMSALLKLLENFWILKDKDLESYYELKNLDKDTREFITKNLGLKLIITTNLVKLEKVPLNPKEHMGIEEFEDPRDYVFFCLVLAFLEDKSSDDQFLLSNITEFIKMNYPDEEIDWTLYTNRRSLIRVLRFCEKMEMIRIDDGNQELFADSAEAEVLYESTGLSRYFMRVFPKSIAEFENYQQILNSEFEFANGNAIQIADVKRIRAYRGLLIDGYVGSQFDQELLYIKRQKINISSELERYIPQISLHCFKSFSFISIDEDYSNSYPDDSNISDIALVVASEIMAMVEKNILRLNPVDDLLTIAKKDFKDVVDRVCEKFRNYWNKEFREKSEKKIFDELIEYLLKLGFIKEDGDFIIIYPIYLKILGEYQMQENQEQGQIDL